ncbi:MAG: hypothetical protein FJZ16_03745 [Candidatus Omnitrophica bacterium]|nr:hypothetical protein [Candidatus Omnitrophota bacterium]
MAYYIKTIGIRGEFIGIFEGRFKKMLSSKMCFKTNKGKVGSIKNNDKLVIYCIRNGVREFPHGGFIGIQLVLSEVHSRNGDFEPPWDWVVDIKQQIQVEPKREITLSEVRGWTNRSVKLENALNVRLLAIGGLLEIEESDYIQFIKEFKTRIK